VLSFKHLEIWYVYLLCTSVEFWKNFKNEFYVVSFEKKCNNKYICQRFIKQFDVFVTYLIFDMVYYNVKW
jgi:hypothetical protein